MKNQRYYAIPVDLLASLFETGWQLKMPSVQLFEAAHALRERVKLNLMQPLHQLLVRGNLLGTLVSGTSTDNSARAAVLALVNLQDSESCDIAGAMDSERFDCSGEILGEALDHQDLVAKKTAEHQAAEKPQPAPDGFKVDSYTWESAHILDDERPFLRVKVTPGTALPISCETTSQHLTADQAQRLAQALLRACVLSGQMMVAL